MCTKTYEDVQVTISGVGDEEVKPMRTAKQRIY